VHQLVKSSRRINEPASRCRHGRYPRRFRQQVMDLTLASVVLRPWWCSLRRKPIVIAEPIAQNSHSSVPGTTVARDTNAEQISGSRAPGADRR
jgi:hypothetical protein